MAKSFRDISFPATYKYSSDSEHIPLEFYEEAFPLAKNIDLLLGYFSSNAIKVLSKSFAEFIYNGGSIRIITNHVYSLKDRENLFQNDKIEDEDSIIDIFDDIEKLEFELSDYGKHFFDCLKYLQKENRLKILPVKFNQVDLAHCKKMILFDGSDYISTDGSINFTLSAITKNMESFEVNAPWKGEIFKSRTEREIENFNLIFEKKHEGYKYLEPEELEVVISKIGRDKDIKDLLDDSLTIQNNEFGKKVEKIINKKKERFSNYVKVVKDLPRFPYTTGARPYQNEAYLNWIKNGYTGVFAMATGTGKTITSLNCVLSEYQKSNRYNSIILVPSIALLNQWEIEVNRFSFKKIIKVGGGNKWEPKLSQFVSDSLWGFDSDLIIISTYGSFVTDRFQKYFKQISNKFILIADEAHNMGANNIKKMLPSLKVDKKIGLTATPKRIYDIEGTKSIEDFFNDSPPYTYNFSLDRALKEGFLCEYKYYPKVVELNEEELKEYLTISKKLIKYFDIETGKFNNDPIVEILLLKRKNIIHKAINKIKCFEEILINLKNENKLKYVFTYVPEGYSVNSQGDSERIIHNFLKAGSSTIPSLKMNTYTSTDEDLKSILRGFSEGKIELLFAMKMLDEGVDVPRAEIGVFCSSTGNPRQFIQRRGRLLRKHKEKSFATIYDMVVIPKLGGSSSDNYNMERNQVKAELQRVAYFASLSMNYYDTKDVLSEVCLKYDINLDEIIQEL